jgi:hypothetical protein
MEGAHLEHRHVEGAEPALVIESPFLPPVDTSVPPAILYAREISAFR